MKRLIGMSLIFLIMLTGCATVTVLKHPGKTNLGVLNAGMSRDNVVTYLGAPISSETENGKRVEIYKFRQGYSGANKATRATLHIVMDALTLFIWELIAWPAEMIFNGEEVTVKVMYDSEMKVEDVTFLRKES